MRLCAAAATFIPARLASFDLMCLKSDGISDQSCGFIFPADFKKKKSDKSLLTLLQILHTPPIKGFREATRLLLLLMMMMKTSVTTVHTHTQTNSPIMGSGSKVNRLYYWNKNSFNSLLKINQCLILANVSDWDSLTGTPPPRL